ncbi:leucine-rich repeat-containing protein 30-like [Pseudophryne corroboree]|uniref:leucine-rich repeat-containing protein 30-like n=1 Tax=Pseudophryne corroboree TaxID=495146 RepID=UPI00308163B9
MDATPSPPLFSFRPGWKTLYESSMSGKVQRKVKIEGRELLQPPLEVFTSEELQILNMSPERESCLSYHMNFVPKQIAHLNHLTVLYMDTNGLEEIPPEIGTLNRLLRLTLSNNSLSSLPAELADLQGLRSLHLANNHFSSFPAVVCQLSSLTFLDVSDNQIEAIPPSIKQLKNLQTFLLALNCVERLPEEFCSLTKLSCLWLGHNKLKELPANFGNLALLDWEYNHCSYNLEGNPLCRPPIDVCSRGPKEIEAYFASC